jgi:FkbM family methyltransferase
MRIPPIIASAEERILLAGRCRDSDDIPKVWGAGKVCLEKNGRRIQTMHNGLKVVADGYCGSWMTELISQCHGHHEPQEERAFHEVVSRLPGDATMIELGGYWAYYTNWFLMDQPGRTGLVIEPDPIHLEVGKTNASLNSLSPIFRHGFAGRRSIAQAKFKTANGADLRLPCFSVPQLLAEMRWKKLDVLHCDIQGAEVEILESCVPLLKSRCISWIFISTHVHHISGDPLTHERCLDIVNECGGIVEAEHDAYESFSGDGLIVARFKPAPETWKPIQISYNRHSQSLFRSLSYDLADCNRRGSSAIVKQVVPGDEMSSCLRSHGNLLEITRDCALGSVGETLILPKDKVISPAVLSAAEWEYSLIERVSSRLNRSRSYTLLDIGANIGLFSRQLLKRSPIFKRVICVEPHPENFAMLRYNLGHLLDKVEPFNIAFGSADGEALLYCDTENFGNYSLASDAMRNRSYWQVPIFVRETGDWMMRHIKEPGALVWKSDVQGYDEIIVAATPLEVWSTVEIAVMEIWRIRKPAFDLEAFRARLDYFPYRQLGDTMNVTTEEVIDYAVGDDWTHSNLVMWK